MEILTKVELLLRKKEIISRIKEGEIFIYPTDTIYGIGCSALNEQAVERVRLLKGRFNKPFSVIAPSLTWVKEVCQGPAANKWISKLPGPYTLITKLKQKNLVAKSVNLGQGTLGIRLPNHWFTSFVAEIGVPIITTSVNKSGGQFMTDLKNIDKDIEQGVDFIIFEGEKEARPSTLVNLVDEKKIKR